MGKKLIKCQNIKAFNLMKDIFIEMEKNLNAKEFIIFTQVKCSRKTMKNIWEIQSILFIPLKDEKINYVFILLSIKH